MRLQYTSQLGRPVKEEVKQRKSSLDQSLESIVTPGKFHLYRFRWRLYHQRAEPKSNGELHGCAIRSPQLCRFLLFPALTIQGLNLRCTALQDPRPGYWPISISRFEYRKPTADECTTHALRWPPPLTIQSRNASSFPERTIPVFQQQYDTGDSIASICRSSSQENKAESIYGQTGLLH